MDRSGRATDIVRLRWWIGAAQGRQCSSYQHGPGNPATPSTTHLAQHTNVVCTDSCAHGSAHGDLDLLLWSVPGGQQLGRIALSAKNGEPVAAAFSPDGQLLRVMIGGTLQVWSVATQQLDATVEIVKRDSPYGPPSASFASDGEVIAISWGGEIWLTYAADGSSLFPDEGDAATLSAGGAMAAVRTQDGQVRLVALVDGSSSEIDLSGFELLAFRADGRTLATGGDHVRLWRAEGICI